MKSKFLVIVTLGMIAFAIPLFSQVATKSGTIYGRVIAAKGGQLPGTTVTLESDATPPQTATSGPTGGFRFANLPPGSYAVTFSMEGFTQLRQEDVRVSVGGSVELAITLSPTLGDEILIVEGSPLMDTRKTGNESTFSREYLDKVPSGRDP